MLQEICYGRIRIFHEISVYQYQMNNEHIGYVRGKFQKNNVLVLFLWSHIT